MEILLERSAEGGGLPLSFGFDCGLSLTLFLFGWVDALLNQGIPFTSFVTGFSQTYIAIGAKRATGRVFRSWKPTKENETLYSAGHHTNAQASNVRIHNLIRLVGWLEPLPLQTLVRQFLLHLWRSLIRRCFGECASVMGFLLSAMATPLAFCYGNIMATNFAVSPCRLMRNHVTMIRAKHKSY